MNKTRIIKRYQNRKLYDTYKSCYVTLDQIARMLKEGDDVTVIDNKTQNDITAPTLIQIIFEGEKKSENPIPTPILKNVVRKGEGAILDYITRSISDGIASRYLVRDELEKHFDTLVEKNIVGTETKNRILNELTSTESVPSEEIVREEEASRADLESSLNTLHNTISDSVEKL
jgi:polyhydroxyalkanoate synthesis repressor PhaR